MYGFNYSDADGDDSASADIENMHYTAKCMLLLVHHCVHSWVGTNHSIVKKTDTQSKPSKSFMRSCIRKKKKEISVYSNASVNHSKADGTGAVQ